MDILIAFLFTVAALIAVLMVRNCLVYSVRSRAIDVIYESNLRAIDDRSLTPLNWDMLGSYDAMLFDIRKWTFRQFYPELV